MAVNHLISLRDLSDSALRGLVDRAQEHADGVTLRDRPLRDRIVGIYFRKTSTRTRTAFTAATFRLGGHVIALGPHDLQENTGESIDDTGRVLALMLDCLVARTAGPEEELRRWAQQDRMSVINAMTAAEHPTQVIGDLALMKRHFGRIAGLRVLYVGEGNNTAAALALSLPRLQGAELHLRTPHGYGLAADILEQARCSGGVITEAHHFDDLPLVDVVYTTRWQTTGTTKPDADWRATFAPFHVDEGVMARLPGALFMHDLPACRGEECSAAVLDGPSSIAFEQAEFKLYGAMAVLEWCLPAGGKSDD